MRAHVAGVGFARPGGWAWTLDRESVGRPGWPLWWSHLLRCVGFQAMRPDFLTSNAQVFESALVVRGSWAPASGGPSVTWHGAIARRDSAPPRHPRCTRRIKSARAPARSAGFSRWCADVQSTTAAATRAGVNAARYENHFPTSPCCPPSPTRKDLSNARWHVRRMRGRRRRLPNGHRPAAPGRGDPCPASASRLNGRAAPHDGRRRAPQRQACSTVCSMTPKIG